MESKKNADAQLGPKRNQFLLVGTVVALSLTICAFEYRSYGDIGIITYDTNHDVDLDWSPPVTEHEILKPPKPITAPIFVEVENDQLTDDLIDIVIDENELELFNPDDYEEPVIIETAPEYVTYAEQMPEFEGGMNAFLKYVAKHTNYPSRARGLGVEGKVFVEFIIDTKGKVTQVKAIKGIGAGCDEEAVRVLKNAPSWTPGKQRGVPVKVKMVVPINFTLQ